MTPAETVDGPVAPDPRPAPPDLETLRRFVNSDNRYYGVDHLASDERAEWCARALPDLPVDEVDADGWRRLVELRTRVRAVIAREPGARAALSEVAERYPMVAGFGSDTAMVSELRPAAAGQEPRLAVAVLAALHTAGLDGRIERLHLCARPDCGWCYYDKSRNRSARWCSSDPCGDVMKTRAYRERHRAAD